MRGQEGRAQGKWNQGYWIMRILALIICALIVLYMGYHILALFDSSVTTVTTVLRTSAITQPVEGVIVRDEALVPLPGGLLEFTVSELERVSRGQTLAVSYQSEETKQKNRELQTLKSRRGLLESVMRQGASVTAAGATDERIRQQMAALLANMDAGRVSAVPDAAAELKTLIFHQTYSYESAEKLIPVLRDLDGRIDALSASMTAGLTALTADGPGLFSSVNDGLEEVWTPDLLAGLSVAEYERLSAHQTAPPDWGYYRLVRDWRWFFVFPMPSADAARLPETVEIRFGDEDEITMRRYSVSPAEDGRRIVVLTNDRRVPYVFSARNKQAEIIHETFSGVRIPVEGIRFDMETGQRFVFCLVLGRVVRKNVDIMDELNHENYSLSVHTPGDQHSLLPGDEVIVAGRNLFDGKVLWR